MSLTVEYKHQSKRVRVTPGTTMFQVLEEAREQFGLPCTATNLELLHRNRAIDLSIPFRLTGVPNNASIELKETASGAAAQQVRVCIQLLDRKRVQAPFGNDQTLAAILQHFNLLPAQAPFSLSFLQREVEQEAFESTTLRDLGIVSGSAMFRVQGAAGTQATAPAPTALPPAPAQPSSPVRGVSSDAPMTAPAKRVEFVEPVASNPPAPQPTDVEMTSADVDSTASVPQLSAHDALQQLRDSCFDAVSRTAVMTLMKIVTNILSNPENEKMQSIRVSNAAFQRAVGQHCGGVDFLLASGFALDTEAQALKLKPFGETKKLLEEGLQLLYREADDLRIESNERPVVVKPVTPDANFDVFKPQITRVQMQPRGPSTTEVLVESLKSKQDKLLSNEIPARNTTVILDFRKKSRTPGDSMDFDLDDKNDSQPSDSQLLIASMKARRAEMEKAQNFRTQAMRELDELKRKRIYQVAVIRVQFPDRVVLQAAFHPSESIQSVIDLVIESLDAPFTGHRFHLYVTPPMQKLDPTKSLSDLNLVPAAHVYLSWTDSPSAVVPATSGFYLRADLLCQEQAESKDDSSATIAYPKPLTLDGQGQQKPTQEIPSMAAGAKSGGETKAKGGKKPSWLKL